jgi:hypothetical protein
MVQYLGHALSDSNGLRLFSLEFHVEFHGIELADVAKRENVRVSWDVR